jgi:DHA1 family multidrug resistance protein-like MFS transporter
VHTFPALASSRLKALGRGLDRSLLLLAAIAFVTQTGVAIMLPLLPLYATELGASPGVLGWLTSIFAVTNAGGQLVSGYLADRIGPRRLVPAGTAIYAGCNILIATATSALPLLAWRGLAGLGGGITLVGERLYLRGVVDQARLAFANGLLSAAGSAGQVLGPAVGALVAAAADLRAPFVIVGLTSLAASAAALFLPRLPERRSAPTVVMATGAATRSRRLDLGVLLLANLALMAGFGSFITTYAPYATTRLDWSLAEVGILFSVFGLGDIFLGPWLANMADRHGRRRVGALATVPITAFSVALVAGIPSIVLYPIAAIAGGGIAGFSAAWFALLGAATGGPRGGRTFGAISAISSLGIVVGAMTAAQLWERVDIRAGMLVTVVAVIVAGVALYAYREAGEPDAVTADPAGAPGSLTATAKDDEPSIGQNAVRPEDELDEHGRKRKGDR